MEGGVLLEKGLPCWRVQECGSSDGVALYSEADGVTPHREHCFVCNHTRFLDGVAPPREPAVRDRAQVDFQATIATAQPRAIASRKLTQESARKWDYLVRTKADGAVQHLAVYRDPKGGVVGIKIRNATTGKKAGGTDDDFYWEGSAKGNLYGRHLWGSGGKKVVIAEGEIDALTISQAQSHQWPVVSLPNGAAEAAKAVAANLEWLNSFEEVLLGFDMDAPGRDACIAAAKLLPPGKAKIVKWTEKDANAMLVAGHGEQITRCIWNAEEYRPDGIVDARDLTEACLGRPVIGIPWPWKFLTDWTYGRRPAEVISFGAGYGIGKSDLLHEIVASTIKGETRYGEVFAPQAFALFAYEAGAATTKKAIAGKLWGRRFHIPQPEDCEDPEWTMDELHEAMAFMDQTLWGRGGELYINDSKGSADWETVKERARFLHHAHGVCHFAIDPLSAMVEEDENSDKNERKIIDRIMREAAKLALELQSTLYIFSHLTRPALGPSHEEGGQVRGNQFRGSNAIGMFSDFMLGAERNTQAEDRSERAIMTLRMVKDRFTGNSAGNTGRIVYDSEHGIYDTPVLEDFEG